MSLTRIEVSIRQASGSGLYGWVSVGHYLDGREEQLEAVFAIEDKWAAHAAAIAEAKAREESTGTPAYVVDLSHAPVVRMSVRQFERASTSAMARWKAEKQG